MEMQRVKSEMTSDFKQKRHLKTDKPLSFSIAVSFTAVFLAAFFSLGCPRLPAAESAASADADSQEKAMSYNADKISITKTTIELIGNAVINQGETNITADRVTVFFKLDETSGLSLEMDGNIQDSFEKITAFGSVKIVSADIIATADESVYDLAAGSIVMTGNPAKIVKGIHTMSAPTIEMVGTL
jgi:lipopolysaccharide export system protein LptA